MRGVYIDDASKRRSTFRPTESGCCGRNGRASRRVSSRIVERAWSASRRPRAPGGRSVAAGIERADIVAQRMHWHAPSPSSCHERQQKSAPASTRPLRADSCVVEGDVSRRRLRGRRCCRGLRCHLSGSGGLNQVPELAHGDREPRQVERAAGADVRQHLSRALDGAAVSLQPALDELPRRLPVRARTDDVRGQARLLRVDVVPQCRPCHRRPARVARQADDPVAQPLQLELLPEPEIDLGDRDDVEP